ncbi:interferon-induced very large GTPase 1-like [Mantella aurantiaca]
MEEWNVPPCDTTPDDSRVTSQHNPCEEYQNEKTEDVPHEQSNSAIYRASHQESVLHMECDSAPEESKDGSDRDTSTKFHSPPDHEMEEWNVPPCDTTPDDSRVTSQHNPCEEYQNEKTEDVPREQINSEIYRACPHESVLHQECDSAPEESKDVSDRDTSTKITSLQNDQGYCEGKRDTELHSDGFQRIHRQECDPTSEESKDECDRDTSLKITYLQNDQGFWDNDGSHSHPPPDHEMEENQAEKTENVPHEQINSDIYKASPHESVLHMECDSAPEESKDVSDRDTSCKMTRATVTVMDHIPITTPDDSRVTSQHIPCEEYQNEKTEDVPHEQINSAIYRASHQESVLHQECDSAPEESKDESDRDTSMKITSLQIDQGYCDNHGSHSHSPPDYEMEEWNVPPCDTTPDDSRVTSQLNPCEEYQNEKTEDVPHEQSNSDIYRASHQESVLHMECDPAPEESKDETEPNTSSKITSLQNNQGFCDGKWDTELSSDGFQRIHRQAMSHPSPHEEMEKRNVPLCDETPDDSEVTPQRDTCEENQNEKIEAYPYEQSNINTHKASPHESVLCQEGDSSEISKARPEFNSLMEMIELMQNNEAHHDNGSKSHTEITSEEVSANCSSEVLPDGELTSSESALKLQNATKDLSYHEDPETDASSSNCKTSTHSDESKESVTSTQSRKEIQDEKEILFKELLEKMNIDANWTSKLTLQRVLEVGPESLMADDSGDNNGLWYFVRRLMSLNGEARNINKHFIKSEANEDNEKDDNFMFLIEDDLLNCIHPLDVVTTAFHCSDHFLQQEMMSKMSMCQFAVPLLLPDVNSPEYTFMLWAMRGIVKKWRPQSLADSKGFVEDSLVNISMPTISFVRLGNCRLSKSKILNQLLGSTQHQHEHFVHRDMEGGNAARKISEGLVEICWYFPGGKGKFPEPVAFTNLRGKLESNLKQFNFLTEISSVIVILTEGISEDQYELLMKHANCNTKYLLIIIPENNKAMKNTQERLKLLSPVLKLSQDNVLSIPRSTNETTAGVKLYSSLLSLVQNDLQTLSLETMADQASSHGIRRDEDLEECQKAKLKAEEITDDIQDVVKYKKETMKLQAEPLKQMAKLEKEMCQMKGQGNSNGEKYKSNLRKQCQQKRQEQWACDIPSGISKFVNAMASTNSSEKFYFLQWLKFKLDLVARKCLYPLQAQYKEKCNFPGIQKELTELDQRISDSSLGIEHFLREVGQFYEAWHAMGKKGKSNEINFKYLPKIAAELLLDGFPLELIDGDASTIPLQWIKDVLTELEMKINGKNRLRVLTVLGVQSTGKSTLLNTMFGLQFPVASGRCTRGAFMTLLRVKENFQDDLRCQFILVIDTEGLKAPELDSLDGSYEHDNELATLVIGLSDITLINMAMENTTEMKDILQIVIHAFLRMKEIGKKPNCQFVHQNVSDVSAPLMNMRGRKKLMDQLDELTRTVAAMENKTQVKYFSDIMEYDLEHGNCYIAGLWHGVPPMASISSAYSENVNELKQKLLRFMKDGHNKTHNIHEFMTWVSDLWSAVKHENFIFSFRNSLIAKAYNQLSKKYSEREWKFNKLMHEWFTKSETLIKNQSAETIEAKANDCYKEAEIILTREEKRIISWLNEYFTKETECVQLIKYKADFMISAETLRKSLETSSFNKLNEAIQLQKEQIKIQQTYAQHIERIEQKVSIFIEECRKKMHELSDTELEEELENIWKDTIKDLKVTHRPPRDIEGAMLLVLTKEMKEKGSGVNEKLQRTTHFPRPKGEQSSSFFTYIGQVIRRLKKEFRYDDFFQLVLSKCIKYSKEQAQKGVDYDNTYCTGVLKIIDENCRHEDAKSYFSAVRELDLKLAILGHVLEDFETMHLNFLKKNDPHAILESLKPLYFDTFKNVYQKKNESKSLAERICKNFFKSSLTDHINRKLGIEMVDDIANSKGSEKYTSRMFFQFTVLEQLLEENNFDKYVEYSSDYKSFVKSWITNYIVNEYKNISTLQDKILSDIMERVRSSLKNPPTLDLQDVSEFLAHLCQELNSDLVLPQQTMKAIIFENSATIEDFIEYMKISLTDTEKVIKAELESLTTEDILFNLKVKPQDELFKKVFGCGKQCPFCNVPCEAGGTDHKEHHASVHRPEGLGTYRWLTTQVLCHDICSTLVVGNTHFINERTNGKSYPFKDFRDLYPDWKIQPDESIEASDYWKFVLKEYNGEFAEEYNAKPANYPEEWNSLTREMAKKSLQKTFNM